MSRKTNEFQTIHSEGGLLPPDLLRRVINPKEDLPGIKPEDYGLPHGERINETITQSWNRLCRHWIEFREAAKQLPEGEAGTGLTNDKWSVPLLRELGFGMVPTTAGPIINGKTYAINRFFGPTAIHLIGCGLNLDRRTAGAAGAAKSNPHGLVQEFLNRSQGHLWAILSNGLRLRILRDSQALSRQSYLEFDLEAMFDGEVFSDFVLLWLIAHATRFAIRENDRPESCWLEQWTKIAEEQGTRALDSLKAGVEKALEVLGQGFVGHPHNTALRESLRSGQLSLSDFHGQLLRVVYRLIFLFVAEDRTLDGVSLIHPPDNTEKGRLARERYAEHYSTARLRELASKIKGSRHSDLWQQLNLLVGALCGEVRFAAAREQLALPILGSYLWNPNCTSGLNAVSLTGTDGVELTNFDFLESLRHLAFTRQGKALRPVDYRNIGAEEIGGVYESLLALTPQLSGDGARFTFAEFAGNERKTSGSYYTPDSLVQCLLDSALDPVVEEAIRGKDATESEKALLALKVCDPAVGSGHFLVGAAHRLARHLARVRAVAQGESEPSPVMYQHALRDVIGHCLYGVDINPMAVELCKVSLWIEAIEPGKPLSFLEHRIKCGNSLLGTTPALLAKGIPDEAFSLIEGDDKKYCALYKKANKQERQSQQQGLFARDNKPWDRLGDLPAAMQQVDSISDDQISGITEKQKRYEELVRSTSYENSRLWADAWCAGFVWRKTKEFAYPITEEVFRRIEHNPHSIPPWMKTEIIRLSEQYQFFHWHIEFPDVFRIPAGTEDPSNREAGWIGGFDVVLGNPPWERIKLQEKEWFAQRRPEIANATNAAARRKMIDALAADDPVLLKAFLEDRRKAEGDSQLVRESGRFPLCGRGDINTYAVFAENKRTILSPKGRVGCVVPSGIATDDTTKFFFQDLMDKQSLASLYDFENRAGLFPDVDSRMKFCLLTLSGNVRPIQAGADFVFFAQAIEDLKESERHFSLTADDIALLNPNTCTCPIFRSKKDAELAKRIYRLVPIMAKGDALEDGKIDFKSTFHMSGTASHFRTRGQMEQVGYCLIGNVFKKPGALNYLPLYESKLFHQFDHRFADVVTFTHDVVHTERLDDDDHINPQRLPLPRYWLPADMVYKKFSHDGELRWIAAYRKIARSTDDRSMIMTVFPPVALGDSINSFCGISQAEIESLCGCTNSFVFDYNVRLFLGGMNLSFWILKQMPFVDSQRLRDVCPWDHRNNASSWVKPRLLELLVTTFDLSLLSADLSYDGPPFAWNVERRFSIRCELDAAYFHFYLPSDEDGDWKRVRRAAREETAEELSELKKHFPTPRHAVDYIMETFPIVKRKDEDKYGEFRTKRVILEIYDEMGEAMRTGKPYQTRLDPPPGPPTNPDGTFAKLPDWPAGAPKPANWPPHIHEPRRE